MKFDSIIGVYKIISPSGRIYIGSSIDLKRRYYQYSHYKGIGQKKLERSIAKYGWDAHIFEVIEYCQENELLKKERFYGDLYNALDDKNLNLSLPGYDNVSGKYSEESKIRRKYILKGRKFSIEHREKLRQANIGKRASKETRKKLSDALRGKKAHPNTIQALRNRKGKKFSESHRLNLKAALQNKSEQTRAKMRAAYLRRKNSDTWMKLGNRKGYKNSEQSKEKIRLKKAKDILCLQTGIFYFGVKEAAKAYGHNVNTLACRLNDNITNHTSLIFCDAL